MSASPSRLDEAREQVYTELGRVDSKAATLLSAVSVFVAAAVFALDKVTLPTLSQLGLGVAAVPIVAAVVLLLDAIRPRLGGNPRCGTWLYAARHGRDSLLDDSASVEDLADHTVALGRSAARKYVRVAIAVWLIQTGLVLLVTSLTVAALS
jgi:hypothetical protein